MIRLAVRVRRADAELALADLLTFAPSGVEETDISADVVEFAIYGAPGEIPELPDLEAAAGGALVEIRTTEVADDWSERWRAFHQPILVGGRLHVRPPWCPPHAAAPGEPPVRELVIDPGQAFGTGAHDTTRLCLELLLGLADDPMVERGAVVDVGCGSGVLAIAAVALGWGPAVGVDHDPASVQATRENAAVNGVAVAAHRHDLVYDGPSPHAPLVLANLLRPLLLRVAQEGFAQDRVPDRLIASGLLRAEADEVADAFAQRLGLVEADRREGGEWAALLLQRA
ncbi:methyltransferase [Conexibacter sp. W3-3-2]|uniref:50S ribosomal protein L11 methyltransferase n=1 Tax=Conexibacter sp. W3-3-2 TaxID=2675227 RepID=UPI001327E119|nr:50S ribosomal protein L11 methyltransferase [Conexibacter sp. W3-3-2]MTD42815.1 methyltransferase [Conexibacter sp. W3-3-2]